MCVILVCQEKAPTKAILEACAEKNPHGAGMAWRDGNVVKFTKGLNFKVPDILKVIDKIKLPYIIHFRISSVGIVASDLCHPFPFGAADQRWTGETKHGVLFHNGTYHQWKSELRDMCRATGRRLPDGRWSDSRAMAALAGAYGSSYLHLLDEKIAYLTPTEIEIIGTFQQGWKEIDKIWFSNDLWLPEKKTTPYHYPGNNAGNTGTGATNAGPVVGSFAGRGQGTARTATLPTPVKKPAECGHDSTYHWTDSRRFCVTCGIRLDNVKNEPWVSPPYIRTEQTVLPGVESTDPDTTLPVVAVAKTIHTQNIAERVKRLCVRNVVETREGIPPQMH